MTLRNAWLLLFVLFFATVAQADPVVLKVQGDAEAMRGPLHVENLQMATTLGAVSHDGLSRQFITASPTIPAPEPATLALFGTGLIGVATLVRFRARRSGRRK